MNALGERIVVARTLPEAGLALLRSRYELDLGGTELDRKALLARARGAAALVADPAVVVDAALLEAAGSSLRVVANFAVGFDNVDLDACIAAQVRVTNTPDVLTDATAELALTLLLAAARKIVEGDALVRSGRWNGWAPDQLLGKELSGSVVGIVGLGRIGARLAKLLTGFDCDLRYTARKPRPDLERSLGVRLQSLSDLLADAEFVSLHVPLTDQTRHMIGFEALKQMRPGAVLVNTSRGPVVDTAALIDALERGHIGAAGLDVYEDEPRVPAELIEMENVVLAPHIGSATTRTRDAMARLVADNVIAVLEGGEPLNPVL